jgi:hypothetical protein
MDLYRYEDEEVKSRRSKVESQESKIEGGKLWRGCWGFLFWGGGGGGTTYGFEGRREGTNLLAGPGRGTGAKWPGFPG